MLIGLITSAVAFRFVGGYRVITGETQVHHVALSRAETPVILAFIGHKMNDGP